MLSGKRLHTKVAPFALILSAVAHRHRIAMVYLLSYDDMTLKDFRIHLGLSSTVLAHHSKVLIRTGWVRKRREGSRTYYVLLTDNFRYIPTLLAKTPFGEIELAKKI